MTNRESSTSWKDFLLALKARGLRGVILAVSDDHPGLKRAIMEVLPESYWQRCYVHFMRNALDYLLRVSLFTRAFAAACLRRSRIPCIRMSPPGFAQIVLEFPSRSSPKAVPPRGIFIRLPFYASLSRL